MTRALLALFTLVAAEQDAPFRIAKLLYSDTFTRGMNQWMVELEEPGLVEARNGTLHLDVPAGASVWFRPELRGPLMIPWAHPVLPRRQSDLRFPGPGALYARALRLAHHLQPHRGARLPGVPVAVRRP